MKVPRRYAIDSEGVQVPKIERQKGQDILFNTPSESIPYLRGTRRKERKKNKRPRFQG